MMLIQAWISKLSQLYKCECGLLLLSMHFSQYNEKNNILSLRFIPQGIFEFCRQKKLLESYGLVGNIFSPSFLAYDSKVAKLVFSKLPQTFTFGPMSIKKKKVLTPKNCSLEFLPENSSLPQQSMNIKLFNSVSITCSNISSGKTKDGVCFSIGKIFMTS